MSSVFSVDKPEESPGFLLWQTTITWQRLITKALDIHNISHAQFVILAITLWFESQNHEVSQSLIIRQSKLDKMTVSKSFKKLVTEGYVKRREHKEDTRVKSIFLTQKGRALISKLIPIVEKIDENFFGVLKKSDQNSLINVLNILAKNDQKNQYTIRHAKPQEANELTSLAFLSKSHWGYPADWLEAWRPELTVTANMMKNSIAYVVELDGEIVGFWCRSAQESSKPSPGLLFIHPNHMGKGLGKLLFEQIKKDALKRGITYFTIEADPNAVPFYEKMGAEKIGERESSVVAGRKIPILRFNFKK